VVLVDSKTLATIIAVAKKESLGYLSDFSKLEAKIEGQLKALHKEEPIVETPGFVMHNGCLYCTWSSGRSFNLGNIRGGDGEDGTDGVDGINGLPGLDGKDGSDGAPGDAGKNGVDGDKGKVGNQGLRGAKGPVGIQGDKGISGLSGLDGTDGRKGLDGEDGEDGVSVEKLWVDDKYHLTIRLSSGKVLDAGYVRGPAGVSGAGKGGRVTGYGGGTGQILTPKGTAILDFGTGSLSTEVVVTGVSAVREDSVVMVAMRIEATDDHPVDDLLIDPIRVVSKDLVTGVGFTIYGHMDNSRANGTYNIHWSVV
tara:strand:+ start:3635 stop:4564 length:930 start_codon:yes stop_codon:yes gene_type:complete